MLRREKEIKEATGELDRREMRRVQRERGALHPHQGGEDERAPPEERRRCRAAAAASARAHCDRAASAQFGAVHTESAVSQCSCGSAPRLANARRAEDAKTETSARHAAHARASKSKRCAGDALL